MPATYTFRLETVQRPRQRLQYVGVVVRQEGQAPMEVYRTEPDTVMGAVVVDCAQYIADARGLDARGIRTYDDPEAEPMRTCESCERESWRLGHSARQLD